MLLPFPAGHKGKSGFFRFSSFAGLDEALSSLLKHSVLKLSCLEPKQKPWSHTTLIYEI